MLREKETISKKYHRAITVVGGSSLTIVLPKEFAVGLGLDKGEYAEVSREGSKIIKEPINKLSLSIIKLTREKKSAADQLVKASGAGGTEKPLQSQRAQEAY